MRTQTNLDADLCAYDPAWGWHLLKEAGVPSAYAALQGHWQTLITSSHRLNEAITHQDATTASESALALHRAACQIGALPLALAAMSLAAGGHWLFWSQAQHLLWLSEHLLQDLEDQLNSVEGAL